MLLVVSLQSSQVGIDKVAVAARELSLQLHVFELLFMLVNGALKVVQVSRGRGSLAGGFGAAQTHQVFEGRHLDLWRGLQGWRGWRQVEDFVFFDHGWFDPPHLGGRGLHDGGWLLFWALPLAGQLSELGLDGEEVGALALRVVVHALAFIP